MTDEFELTIDIDKNILIGILEEMDIPSTDNNCKRLLALLQHEANLFPFDETCTGFIEAVKDQIEKEAGGDIKAAYEDHTWGSDQKYELEEE